MKKLFFLFLAASGAANVNAQTPGAPEMPVKKSYTHDSLLQRWVIDVNALGGVLTQDIQTHDLMSHYNNVISGASNYSDGGKLKFSNGMSYGFDAQLGFFFGHKRHFGIGAGFMYLHQQGDLATSYPLHIEYQATDARNDVYRQIISSNGTLQESVKITNMNIPVVLKYKKRFSKRWGFTADAGALFNVQIKNAYTSGNTTFDYEAIYNYTYDANGKVSHTNYDNSPVPAANDVLLTKGGFNTGTKYATVGDWFNALRSNGYNVGLGVTPNNPSGNVSYKKGSVGLLLQPSLNFYCSDNFALNLGVYYIYQPFMNDANTAYQVTNKAGDYSSVLNNVKSNNFQSYGVNAGIRFLFGKPKDTDHDGVPDKTDKCPTVPGVVQMFGCPDQDGDGITDMEDSCVTVPGTLKFHGCPDSDGDGIADKDDACPFVPGIAKFNGCPDKDGDGIPDKEDACPDKPGVAKYHGCPDTDGDGVPDNEDACPGEPGPESNHGCPVPPPPAQPETVKISTPILFEVNKTEIQTVSYPVLEEAVRRLNEDKESYVIVDGYTDITGKPVYNKKLSLRRANAVKAKLIKMGVKANRIKVIGNGSKHPADTNNTPEGRAKNRRAVMHLNMAG